MASRCKLFISLFICWYSNPFSVKAKKKGASQKDVNVDDVEGIIDLRELKQSMESIVENVKDAFRKKYSARINPGRFHFR